MQGRVQNFTTRKSSYKAKLRGRFLTMKRLIVHTRGLPIDTNRSSPGIEIVAPDSAIISSPIRLIQEMIRQLRRLWSGIHELWKPRLDKRLRSLVGTILLSTNKPLFLPHFYRPGELVFPTEMLVCYNLLFLRSRPEEFGFSTEMLVSFDLLFLCSSNCTLTIAMSIFMASDKLVDDMANMMDTLEEEPREALSTCLPKAQYCQENYVFRTRC